MTQPADFCRGCGCHLPPRADETYCRAIEPMRRHMEDLHAQVQRLTRERADFHNIDDVQKIRRLRAALEGFIGCCSCSEHHTCKSCRAREALREVRP